MEIRSRRPREPYSYWPAWRILDDVEYATMEWVDWYNGRRLHSQLNYIPPEEYQTTYYAQTQASQPATPQP